MLNNKFVKGMILGATVVSLLVIVTFLATSGMAKKEVNFEDLKDQVVNILNSEPHAANEANENYIFYIPSEYEYTMNDTTVVLENSAGIFTMYMGYDTKVDQEFINAMNPNKDKVYEYVDDKENEITYFAVWVNDENTYNVVLGVNDIFIEGIVTKDKIELYVIDMATILNSVQQINNKEEIDVNGEE